MLFVCRKDIPAKVVVYNTETRRETVYTQNRLRLLVECGLEVKGVERVHERSMLGTVSSGITFNVYQHPDFEELWQSKLLLLQGVACTVYDGTITALSWRPYYSGTPIRLSKYCKVLNSCMFLAGDISTYDVTLNLVLDDSIAARKSAFDGIFIHNIRVDIRDVTDERLIQAIYNEYVNSDTELIDPIIDREDRLNYHQGVRMIENMVISLYTGFGNTQLTDETVQKLYKKYSPEFKLFFLKGARIKKDRQSQFYLAECIKMLVDNAEFWRSRSTDFVEVYQASKGFLENLRLFTTVSYPTLSRLCVYLAKLPVQDDIKAGYVKFTNRLVNKLLDYGTKIGIVGK